MSSTDLTRDWLQQVLRPYPAKDRILQEVMDVLPRHRSLAIKTDTFSQSTPFHQTKHRSAARGPPLSLQSSIPATPLCCSSSTAPYPSLTVARRITSLSTCGSRTTTPEPHLWRLSSPPVIWACGRVGRSIRVVVSVLRW